MKIAALLLLAVSVCHADITVIVNNVTVEVGEDAVLPCSYESSSEVQVNDTENSPTFTWSLIFPNGTKQRLAVFNKGDGTLFTDKGAPPRTPPLTINDKGSLLIRETTLKDNTLYAKLNCEVSLRDDGLKGRDVSFLAALLPRDPATVSISDYNPGQTGFDITGSSMTLGSCKTSKSYPPADITFYKNGAPLPVDEALVGLGLGFVNPSTTAVSEDGISLTTEKPLTKTLEISDHLADYICNVKTVYGDEVYEYNYTMPKFNVNYQTTMASFDGSPTAYLGETITLKCLADGYPTPTIRIDDVDGDELKVDVTQDLDKKQYLCKAFNNDMQSASPVVSEPYTMDVLSLAQPSLTGASISNGMVVFRSGDAISINCSSEGNPDPTFSWFKGDTKISGSGKLSIGSASLEDSGDYSCRGTNNHDNLAKSTPLHIEVKGISIVGEEEENVVGKQDEKVTLECTVEANPAPTFTWSGKEEDAEMMSKTTYVHTSHLEVGPLTPELSKKEYTCTATDDDGKVIKKKFILPEIAAGSSSTAIIIVILILILVVAVVLAVLYNKGIICKKSEEKGDEPADGDLEGGMNNEEDPEAGNGRPAQPEDNEDQPPVNNPEEEKLMAGGEDD